MIHIPDFPVSFLIALLCAGGVIEGLGLVALGFWWGRYGPRRNWSEAKWGELNAQAEALDKASKNDEETRFEEELHEKIHLLIAYFQPEMTADDVEQAKNALAVLFSCLTSTVLIEKDDAVELALGTHNLLENGDQDEDNI